MKTAKTVALILAGLLALLAAVATWLVATFDANRYKSVAIDWMRDHKQRTLAIGDVKLSVFPRLQVELSQVVLSEFKQPAQPFVTLASARLSVQLLPLLKQQLVIDQVEARGLSLRYLRNAQGQRNIDDLLQPDPAATPASAPGQPLRFDVSGVSLQDLQVQIDDAMAPLRGQVTLASLQTGRLSPEVMTPVSLTAQARLSQPALNAQLSGSLQLQLDPGDGQQQPLKLATRQVKLDLGLEMGALQLKNSTLALERFELYPAEQRLALDQLVLQLQGQLNDQGASGAQAARPFQLALNWPQLAIQGQQLQGSALSGRFALQGPAALQGTISSGAPSGSFEALKVPALKLTLGAATSGAAVSRINGTVQTDLGALIPTRQVTLGALVIDATVQNPALRPLRVEARGQADASPQTAHWQLAGQLNAQAFSTDGQLTLGGAVPQLQAQARFGELDLDALLPPRPAGATAAKASPAASAPAGKTGPTPDAPVDLSGLRALNATVKLQAGVLKYQPYVVRDLLASATLAAGRLQVAPLSLRTWDGTLEARLTADAGNAPAQQRIAVQATAQDILIQSLLKDVAQTDLLDGRGQLKLDITTGGASVQALKAALNGTAALQLRDGAIKGINLAQQLRQVKALLSTRQDASQQARQTEKTDFSELSASFQIRNGVADNRDLDLKSPFLRLSGAGTVDLPQSRLDYTARTTLTGTAKGQGGADLSALQGLVVPVRLSGPMDALGWRIVWSDVALGGAGNTLKQAGDQLKNKAEERLKAQAAEKLGLKSGDAASAPLKDQLKDKARDAVKDKLKGLFGQ